MDHGHTRRRGRLATLVEARRRDLGLSVSAASRSAGINRATWSALESGSRETASYHFAGIERALAWAPGSVDAILAGGDPTETTPGRSTRPTAPERSVEDELRAIRDNPDLPGHLRRQAQAQLDSIAALLESARAAQGGHTRKVG